MAALVWLSAIGSAEEKQLAWRLPPSFNVTSYRLHLLPVLEDRSRLCGHVWIEIVARTDTNTIVLNALEMEIIEAVIEHVDGVHSSSSSSSEDDNVTVENLVEDLCLAGVRGSIMTATETNASHGNRSIIGDVRLDETNELLLMTAPFQLRQAARYRIGILYRAKINDLTQGFYRVSYPNSSDCCKT